MPERSEEMEHLALADSHILQAEKTVADLVAMVGVHNGRGADSTQAQESLAIARETLTQFRLHRDLIVRTIQDIDAGRL